MIVAHYDSPRIDPLCEDDLVKFRPLLGKLFPLMVIIVPVLTLIKAFPVPGFVKVILWLAIFIAALVPGVIAAHAIFMMFSKQYTTGSVCNKSSVASLLGVMDKVAPYEGDEFPDDIPFEEYMESLPILDVVSTEDVSEHTDEDLPDFEVQGPDDAEDQISPATTNAMPVLDATGVVMDKLDKIENDKETLDVSDTDSHIKEEQSIQDEVQSISGADKAESNSDEQNDNSSCSLDDSEKTSKDPQALRRGADTLRDLGMLPLTCEIEYINSTNDNYEQDESLCTANSTSKDIEEIVDSDSCEEHTVVSQTSPDKEEFGDKIDTEKNQSVEVIEGTKDTLSESDVVNDDSADLENHTNTEDSEETSSKENDDISLDEATPTIQNVIEETKENVAQTETEDESIEQNLTSEKLVGVNTELSTNSAISKADELFDFDPSEFDVALNSDAMFDASINNTVDASNKKDAIGEEVSGETKAFSTDQIKAAEDAAVDALMAEIEQPVIKAPVVSTQESSWGVSSYSPTDPDAIVVAQNSNMPSGDKPTTSVQSQAKRSFLLDLPDPSDTPRDPFSAPSSFTVQPTKEQNSPVGSRPVPDSNTISDVNFNDLPVINENTSHPTQNNTASCEDAFEVISAPAPKSEKKNKHGLKKLFSHKKKKEQSMGEWLGVGDDFSAKDSGREIGSWENFEDDDWKGGAASSEATPEEMLDAVTSLGDDELLGHDIWFVATGASEYGHAGMDTFLRDHRDKLRGVFMINLESIGAGTTSIITEEGEYGKGKGDRRIINVLNQVSSDFHQPFEKVEMPYITTEAFSAMKLHLRAVTIAGVEENHLACSYSRADVPQNIDEKKVEFVSEVVAEAIRRS